MTEVGAVLVGGGELHDRWSSLVGVASPLTRGDPALHRDHAGHGRPRAAARGSPARPGAAAARARARRPQRALRPTPCCAAPSPAPPSTGPSRPCSARSPWPAGSRPCSAAAGSPHWPTRSGSRSTVTHRALPDAETCARVFCALFSRLSAHAATIGDAVALLKAKSSGGAARRPRAGARRRPPSERPDFSALPKDPGVYVFRDADGRPLYVGKSVCLRTRARAHFTTPAAWTGHAEHVDYQATQSELGALLLEDRLIKALRPPGNKRGKRSPDGYVYLRCRLDIPFPILEVAPEPATGHAVTVGPVRGRAAAAELVEQLNSLFGLRHCGRRLPRREHPSAYGQMGRCLSPCLGDLDPNLYRERLDGALRLFVDRRDGGARAARPPGCPAPRRGRAAQLRARRLAPAPARAARGPRRAGSAGCCAPPTRACGSWSRRTRRRRGPLRRLLDRRRPRSSTGAGCPTRPGRAGRAQRRRAARRPAARARRLAPAGEVGEARLVGSWMARHGPPALELDAGVLDGGRLVRWVGGVGRRRDPGLDHVQLAAPPGSEAEARRFFTGLLGLEELEKPAALAGRGGVWFACGAQQLHVGVTEDFAPAEKAHPAFAVDGARRARRLAARRGAASTSTGTTRSPASSAASPATRGATGWSSWLRRRERQLDDLGADAVVADRDRRARLRLAAHDARARSDRTAGTSTTLPSLPTSRSPSRSGAPGATGADRRRPRRWRFGLPRKCSRATVSWPT